ncbi:MAG: hypothetical protein KAG61_12085 [Bacteriovoracaceae bacterium]|nr:hypothetical protein [Bacteriovoracaceae bacterium]
MKNFTAILESAGALSPHKRREKLIEKMGVLTSSGINCYSCEGTCCTFIANSMKTTPLESLDLLSYLQENNLLNDELIKQLKETVAHYRLDYDIDTGRGTILRRTYTCPFFIPGEKGCTISRKNKPYGCLGFNAFKEKSVEGSSCSPDFNLLQEREDEFGIAEENNNQWLKNELRLDWDKLPMPLALLQIITS